MDAGKPATIRPKLPNSRFAKQPVPVDKRKQPSSPLPSLPNDATLRATPVCLSWGTTALHYPRATFLPIQLFGVCFFALTIPVSALLAERGRRPMMFAATGLIVVFGLFMAPLFAAGTAGAVTMMALGLALMGLTYGPLGTVVSELFPTPVRYTGSSLAFSLAGILGASLAPYAATWLAKTYGLPFVGYYLSGAAVLTFVGLLLARETKDDNLS